MKGLYWQQSSSAEETCFVFLEKDNLPVMREDYVKVQVKACALSQIDAKLLSEIKMEKEFLPVGREIAGVVLETGNKVSSFQPHDEVVGILPLDSEESGLCEHILVHEHYLVHKPEKVPWLESAGIIRDGVRAYTALHYLSYVSPGKTVLVMDGASPFGTIAIQLAHHRGAKVISTVYSQEDKQYLERFTPSVGELQWNRNCMLASPHTTPKILKIVFAFHLAHIIDESDGKYDLTESCLEETGGLGVDIILDAGVKLYNRENETTSEQLLPHKHDIITLLSVGGHWVTMEKNLQLDPPDSHCLFLKGATVSFLNDEVWNLSNMQQGKYLCILEDVMEKLSSGVFRPHLDEPVPLYEAKVSMEMVQKNQARKRQVVQL
ncbi:quinone oxidoreductase-like protein 1 isoform X1 [Varanus komodoensis]|uniref:quinone oxidoreductase-like protein 1 isoform X1 n=1 Tax=Varanus komodoensis TaxID=61221 RepID=UPI001CF7AD35|nr:quinone oxidoreductase-like protein 1 isoform X1 [Varanus komodoensis]XP_044298035.1 quinone oxidoreductase-like protein 1 isoform X1 [Varanus komodoensis]